MSAEGRQSPIAHYINTPKWLNQIKNHAECGTTLRAWMSLLSRKTQQKQQSGPSGDVPTVQVGSGFNDLVGLEEQRVRHGEAEHLRGVEVEDKLERRHAAGP